eukprot:2447005-Ditylum_brightwellii.AAC.1
MLADGAAAEELIIAVLVVILGEHCLPCALGVHWVILRSTEAIHEVELTTSSFTQAKKSI